MYFGQLGLAARAGRLQEAASTDGVEIGWDGKVISPGKAGSRELAETAFGQAAALMSVSQLARVGGDVAGRRHLPEVRRRAWTSSAQCEEREILAEPDLAVPILSGMEQVVLAGTARGLQKPAGVRLYGKTGTADAIGTKDEIVVRRAVQRVGPAELLVPRHRGGRDTRSPIRPSRRAAS